MKDQIIKSTEITSYFLWEYTEHTNAIDLWYCAEDIGYYFERRNILTLASLKELATMPKYELAYINFIRNISFRIYLSTKQDDHVKNWYSAESLLHNQEWCAAATMLAHHYRIVRDGGEGISDTIRTEWIRRRLTDLR